MTVSILTLLSLRYGLKGRRMCCGTAAVISPIERIDDLENGKSYVISKDGKPGPVCEKLYNKLRGIQYGDEPDTHGWVTIVE